MAAKKDLNIHAGVDVDLEFLHTPTEPIGGWTIKMYLDTDPVIEKSAIITSPDPPEYRISLQRSDTKSLGHRSLKYEVWRIDAGLNSLLVEGKINIWPTVRPA